jgi:predicted metalloprotease with PDZ domain
MPAPFSARLSSRRRAQGAALLCALLCASAPPPALAADATAQAMLRLSVDLRDTSHRVFRVHETIPARPGPMVLRYPKWIPGNHAPDGPIEAVAGLRLSAGGRTLAWRRDPLDMFAVHVEVPPGADAIDLSLDFLSPGAGSPSGISATPALIMLEWNEVLLYPAGAAARDILVEPSVSLPPGWGWASALEAAGTQPGAATFRPVSLETLVDSPLATGRWMRQIELDSGPAPARLDVFADQRESLAATESQVRSLRRLVSEARALFGSRHYAHYDFLLVLSDSVEHYGLEHGQSSDDRDWPDFFTDDRTQLADFATLSHELVHSWNGKYRRPTDMLAADFSQPIQTDLLWVYEGLTEYWSCVLQARAGAFDEQDFRESLADAAAQIDAVPGRGWNSLQNLFNAAQILAYAPRGWSNWRRGNDFYPEGVLLWLDVDTKLRELSADRQSLDDFARAFFGGPDGALEPRGYDLADVLAALDRIQPFDWERFLRERLDDTTPAAPLGGIERAGWRLVYNDRPNSLTAAREKANRELDLSSSLGVAVVPGESSATVEDVIWNGPAFAAGLAPGMRIVAVNGTRFSADALVSAVRAARHDSRPIRLLVQDFEELRTLEVSYHGGMRYAHLERAADADERLSAIGRPRAAQ